MSNVIATEKLSKSYGSTPVLHRVDLNIAAGKLIGFLGPNGAGKTTTIRIILSLLKPTSGIAKVFGLDSQRSGPEIRARIGYLPGDVHLYSGLTGLATLKHFARVRRINCDAEIKRLSERFELPLRRNVRQYSTGMRQKLGLIQALMHRPELLVLDEPTSALDPLVRTVVFDELRSVVDDGRTVLFSSHSLNEVEELCDEVVILRGGKIVEHQTIEVLRSRALRKVTFVFAEPGMVPSQLPENLTRISVSKSTLTCTYSGQIQTLLDWVGRRQIDDLFIERPDLNDLFITYYSEGDTGLEFAGSTNASGSTDEVSDV